MRLLLLILLLVFPDNQQSAPLTGPKTELEKIYDELSIVNRVINAIALQNAAISKSIKPKDVVVELLQVRHDEFIELMKFDTREVLRSLQNLLGPAFEGPLHHSAAKADLLADSLGASNMIEKLVKEVDDLKIWKAYDIEKHLKFDGVTDLGTDLPCESEPLKLVEEFQDPKRDTVVVYTKLKDKMDLVIGCLEGLKQKAEDYKSPSKVKEELRKVAQVAVLGEWVTIHQGWDELHGKLLNGLDDMDKDYQAAKPIWSRRSSGAELLGKIFYAQDHTTDANHQVHEHLTSGFQNGAADIAKVVADVQSAWFAAKVSRGKSVEPLVKSLMPISKTAGTLAKMEVTWQDLRGTYTENQHLLGRIHQSMAAIEHFQKQPVAQGFLQNAKATLTTCKTNKTVVTISDGEKEALKKANKGYRNLLGKLENIKDKVGHILQKTDISVVTQALRTIKDQIPAKIDVKTSQAVDDKIRGLEAFAEVEHAFEELAELSDLETRSKDLFEQLKTQQVDAKPFKDLQDKLDQTHIVETADCFKNAQFDNENLKRILNFLHNVLDLAEPAPIQATRTYLAGLADIQQSLPVQEANMKSVGASTPVLTLNDSLSLAHHLGIGMEVLHQMVVVQKDLATLQGPLNYAPEVLATIQAADSSRFWKNPAKKINPIIDGIAKLERQVPGFRAGKELIEVRKVLFEAESVPGVSKFKKQFENIAKTLKQKRTKVEFRKAIDNAEILKTWDLDFASHKKTLNAAFLSLESVSWYFDEVFGFKKKPEVTKIDISYWTSIGLFLGALVLCALAGIIGYGFTKNGRRKYRNLFLYYFPNEQVFEKRWRYSLFMDRQDGKNALVDASREVNPINTAEILKKGAYVNVYSLHGNTTLHMATQRGYVEIVELLIKNGADRSLLNVQNKTPEQMIPTNYREMKKEKSEKYAKIEKIYAKYRNKKFRVRVPQEFPSHLFHIFIEPRTDDSVTEKFMDKFRSITSDEALPTTTHCVVKTNENGQLETDNLDLLVWIFNGVIMVKESWMTDCLADPKAINHDSKHLVEHVKYKGVVYENCVLPWSRAMAKGAVPYLYGAYVVVVIPGYTLMETMTSLINIHGGTLLTSFPSKDTFNLGSHPYLHTNIGPIFVIHDGSVNLAVYQNDPDKMFTVFTEEEFVDFLLKRETAPDTSDRPLTVLPEEESS